eukprot:2898993-Amphidinium_carterae.1
MKQCGLHPSSGAGLGQCTSVKLPVPGGCTALHTMVMLGLGQDDLTRTVEQIADGSVPQTAEEFVERAPTPRSSVENPTLFMAVGAAL